MVGGRGVEGFVENSLLVPRGQESMGGGRMCVVSSFCATTITTTLLYTHW